jgi:thioredoxin-like negative regulator of GroEL
VRISNPPAQLRALLDTTRKLDPEEMAELQLEQGYIERALAIYDELAAKEPNNAGYRTRQAWLARMLDVQRRSAAPRAAQREPSVDSTLVGAAPPVSAKVVRRRIVGVR